MNYLEIYIDEFNDKGIQIANAFLDVMRCKLTELGADSTDAFASIFDNSHIEAEQYYMNILSEDLKPIVSDLRNIQKIAIPPATLTIKAWSKISLIKRNIFPFQTGKGASEVETEESKIVKSNYSLFLLSPIVTTKT